MRLLFFLYFPKNGASVKTDAPFFIAVLFVFRSTVFAGL